MFRRCTRNLVRPLLSATGHTAKTVIPKRNVAPISSPPRDRVSLAETIFLGFGHLVVIMIIPYWGLYSLPEWAEIHQQTEPTEDEESDGGEEEAKDEKKTKK